MNTKLSSERWTAYIYEPLQICRNIFELGSGALRAGLLGLASHSHGEHLPRRLECYSGLPYRCQDIIRTFVKVTKRDGTLRGTDIDAENNAGVSIPDC